MWILYQIAVAVALAVAGPFLLLLRGAHYLPTVPGRLGRYRQTAGGEPLWIHAVSVGEAAVAVTLARALPADLPLLVTTVTPTGQALARRALDGRAAVAYLPYDLGFAVDRFYRRFRPRALVLVEGDLWPLVLERARRRGLPVVVVNARLSDRGHRRLERLRRLFGPLVGRLYGALLDRVDRFAVQGAADAARLAALGVADERLAVTGNLKFEGGDPEPKPELERRLAAAAGGRPIVVAGSTMPGEEELVADAFLAVGGGARALLVLAPRHPERTREVEGLLAARGLATVRRSRLDGPAPAEVAVVLLDTVGELAALYRLAAASFVGGTLVPTGGHNPLEPARFGVPIAAGPSMENFRQIAHEFDRARAWRRVADAGELARAWGDWLSAAPGDDGPGARAARLVESNRGALERTLSVLAEALPEGMVGR